MKFVLSVFFTCFLLLEPVVAKDSKEEKDKQNKEYLDEVGYAIKVFKSKFKRGLKKQPELDTKIPIVHFNLGEDFNFVVRDYALKKLESIRYKKFNFSFIQCPEALNVRTELREGKLVLVKGIQNKEYLQEIMRSYGTSYYAEVILTKKRKNVYFLVNVYSTENMNVVWSTEIEVKIAMKKNILYQFSIGYIFNQDTTQPILLSQYFGEKFYGFGEIGMLTDIGFLVGPGQIGGFMKLGVRGYLSLNELFSATTKTMNFMIGVTAKVKFGFLTNSTVGFNGFTTDFLYGPTAKLMMGSVIFLETDITWDTSSVMETGIYLGFNF